jgi:cytochrome c biogenesis protein CcmG/thiol:disulfide interchange protein DsbE
MTRFKIAVVCALLCVTSGARAERLQPMEHEQVPEFSLPSLAGEAGSFTHEQLQGHLSIIHVFSSWCQYCMRDHVLLMKPEIRNLFKAKNIRHYGIVWNDDPSVARTWMMHNGNPYDVLVFDEANDFAWKFGITGIPETFFISKKGVVCKRVTGMLRPEVLDAYLPIFVKDCK